MPTNKQMQFESIPLRMRRSGKKVHIIMDRAFPERAWCGRRINKSYSNPTEVIYLLGLSESDFDPEFHCVKCIWTITERGNED